MFAAASLGSYSKAMTELGQLCHACRVGKHMTWCLGFIPKSVLGQGSMRFTVQKIMKQWLCGLKRRLQSLCTE